MTTDKIKDQLIDFNRQFKKNSGHFKSFEVIFDYIGFLNSEPYLKDLLAPIFDYTNKQIGLMTEIVKNPDKSRAMDNISLDVLNPSNFSEMPVFNQEFKGWQKAIENKEDLAFKELLSINLMSLILVANGLQEIKDCQRSGDIKRANELIEIAKDESFAIMPAHDVKNAPEKVITSAQFLDSSMELINKHIIDKIDAQDFLESLKPKPPIIFDSENSILNIRGEEIKIARQKDRPIDHYILECIFSKDDISDPADYSEISEDFLKEDYDSLKGWNKFRNACDKLNDKIESETKIKDFILYSTEKLGWCKINQKYL